MTFRSELLRRLSALNVLVVVAVAFVTEVLHKQHESTRGADYM